MNLYVVTEGEVEQRVYPSWISFLNPLLSQVHFIEEVEQNNYYLVSGGGYPYYWEIIESAIEDVNTFRIFDRLIISVDAEEMTQEEKCSEVFDFIESWSCSIEVHLIIQNYCFETWALGNKSVVRERPSHGRLRDYMRFYNIRQQDPELLPAMPEEDCNRAQFAERYLRAALNDRFRNLTYTKARPEVLCHPKYFQRVVDRLNTTGHIPSFQAFINAFS